MGYGNVDRLSMQLVIVIDIVGFAPRSGAIFSSSADGEVAQFCYFCGLGGVKLSVSDL